MHISILGLVSGKAMLQLLRLGAFTLQTHYTHYLCKFNCRNNRYGARAVGVLVQVPFWYCGKGNHAAFDIEIRRDSDERTNGLVILDGDT